jgi:EAL domain-containing protein (putative c-di-GMP-specific phosphodiesterase class I)
LEAQVVVPFEGPGRPHYELLLRMIGEGGSTVGPDTFLSAANRYQLMPSIDRWVIKHALALLAPHAPILAGRPVAFAINCSGQSLSDDSFGDFLLSALESSGLDPGLFCFELTETATIMNLARAEVLMRRLRRLGCGIALDDFGTGLSSLSYLRQLPVTMLKIDGSFVRDILKDSRAESMVQAIAQLARSMSLTTVAEYVETEEIRARVATLGVDFAQGFALGRPEPFADVLAQLPMLAAAIPAYEAADGTPPRVANLR